MSLATQFNDTSTSMKHLLCFKFWNVLKNMNTNNKMIANNKFEGNK